MKNSILSLMAASLLLLTIPAQSGAEEEKSNVAVTETKTEVAAEVNGLVDRLEEIKAMDLSELSSSEKKELRKEVRTIKKDLKDYSKANADANANANATGEGEAGPGIYISGGAIIVILLLLLLL